MAAMLKAMCRALQALTVFSTLLRPRTPERHQTPDLSETPVRGDPRSPAAARIVRMLVSAGEWSKRVFATPKLEPERRTWVHTVREMRGGQVLGPNPEPFWLKIARQSPHLCFRSHRLLTIICSNRLTAGSRRSAPWNGSTHPGYSGSRALTSSNCLSSSWVSVSSTAARLS